MVVKAVLVFPVHLVVNAYLHLEHRSVSVVIEMVYGKDHHHYPEACCLSVYADHQAWVGLVVEVMMVVCCTVQDCYSYLGHCQAAVVDPVEGRCWCCC